MGRGLRLQRSLAWLPQWGTNLRPGAGPWALNCTVCGGEDVRDARAETLRGSVTEIACVACLLLFACVCVCVCVCVSARARACAPSNLVLVIVWANGRVVLWFCT